MKALQEFRETFLYESAGGLAQKFREYAEQLIDYIDKRTGGTSKYGEPTKADKSQREFAIWLKDNFRLEMPATPRGMKHLKGVLKNLHWALMFGPLDKYGETIKSDLESVLPHVDDIVRYFSNEGITSVPGAAKVGGTTFVNKKGIPEAKFNQYVKSLSKLFASVKGWRRKALKNLTVALAGPKDFRGTAGGVYKSAEDTLYVRATPKVLKRAAGTYGALDYILIHELGHRYERKFGYDPMMDAWHTTRYSWKEGEQFAEMFALGHFGITSHGGEEFAERIGYFETKMLRDAK